MPDQNDQNGQNGQSGLPDPLPDPLPETDLSLVSTEDMIMELIKRADHGVVILDEPTEPVKIDPDDPISYSVQGTTRCWGNPIWAMGACEMMRHTLANLSSMRPMND